MRAPGPWESVASPRVPLGASLDQSIGAGIKITCNAIITIITAIIIFTRITTITNAIAIAPSLAIRSAFILSQCPWSPCFLFFFTTTALSLIHI